MGISLDRTIRSNKEGVAGEIVRASAITSEINSCTDSCEKVNALPKVVGFLRVLRFPPTGKVDCMGGLGQT